MDPTTFSIRRNGDVDLVFEGVCLVDLHSRMSDDQDYWTEIRIYRTTSNRYVAEMVGVSGKGERPRINVSVLDSPDGLRDALKRKPKEKPAYLTELAIEALQTAAEVDPTVHAALVEHI